MQTLSIESGVCVYKEIEKECECTFDGYATIIFKRLKYSSRLMPVLYS